MKRSFWIIKICSDCEELLEDCTCPWEWGVGEPPVTRVLVKAERDA